MNEIYIELGWQGGTIHQILSEIKRLKEIEQKFNLLIDVTKICEPMPGYNLKDLNDTDNCGFCLSYNICHIVAGNYKKENKINETIVFV